MKYGFQRQTSLSVFNRAFLPPFSFLLIDSRENCAIALSEKQRKPSRKKVDYDRGKTWDVHLWSEGARRWSHTVDIYLITVKCLLSRRSWSPTLVCSQACREHFRLWFTGEAKRKKKTDDWIKFPSNVRQRVYTWIFSKKTFTSWEHCGKVEVWQL